MSESDGADFEGDGGVSLSFIYFSVFWDRKDGFRLKVAFIILNVCQWVGVGTFLTASRWIVTFGCYPEQIIKWHTELQRTQSLSFRTARKGVKNLLIFWLPITSTKMSASGVCSRLDEWDGIICRDSIEQKPFVCSTSAIAGQDTCMNVLIIFVNVQVTMTSFDEAAERPEGTYGVSVVLTKGWEETARKSIEKTNLVSLLVGWQAGQV